MTKNVNENKVAKHFRISLSKQTVTEKLQIRRHTFQVNFRCYSNEILFSFFPLMTAHISPAVKSNIKEQLIKEKVKILSCKGELVYIAAWYPQQQGQYF